MMVWYAPTLTFSYQHQKPTRKLEKPQYFRKYLFNLVLTLAGLPRLLCFLKFLKLSLILERFSTHKKYFFGVVRKAFFCFFRQHFLCTGHETVSLDSFSISWKKEFLGRGMTHIHRPIEGKVKFFATWTSSLRDFSHSKLPLLIKGRWKIFWIPFFSKSAYYRALSLKTIIKFTWMSSSGRVFI